MKYLLIIEHDFINPLSANVKYTPHHNKVTCNSCSAVIKNDLNP